jgi:hypothetical protein
MKLFISSFIYTYIDHSKKRLLYYVVYIFLTEIEKLNLPNGLFISDFLFVVKKNMLILKEKDGMQSLINC